MSKTRRHRSGPIAIHTPAWMRLHHDWRFWVAAILMFGAMIIYLMSDDLARRPGGRPQGPPPATAGQQ
jgi:hypothetical protein